MVENTVGNFVETIVLKEEKSMRVLHVDDEEDFLKVARLCLEREGAFEVEGVTSVDGALVKLEKESFDLIVSDFQMPGKDGLDFLKELRSKENNVPFILFTSRGREEVAIEALNLGADGYYSKVGPPETVYCELAQGIRLAVKRKRAELRIWQDEERLRGVFVSSPDAIMVSDLDGNIVDCNEAALKLGGYSSKEEILGKNSFNFIAEKDRKLALEKMKHIFDLGTIRGVEYTAFKKNGETYVAETSGSVLKDSADKAVGFVIVIRDITEDKQKEKTLQESEYKYKTIFEGSNDGIIEVDPSTRRFVFANPAICRLTGYSEKELLKLKVEDIHPKKDLPFIIEQLEKLARGEKPRVEAIPVLKKDKSLIYCHINGSSLEIGKQRLVVAFFRDITERKEAEEALLKSEEKYRSLVENIDDIVFAVGLNGVTNYVSPSAEKVTGFKLDEVVGKPFLDFFKPTEKKRASSNFARMLKGETVRGVEAVIPRKDGTPVYYEVNMCPVSLNGKIVGIQGVGRDVTERKRWNDELSASKERLSILFERAPDGYYLSDMRGNFIDGNKAAEEITGYCRSELIGKSFLKLNLLPRSQVPKAAKLLPMNVMGKATGPDELILRRKDGTQVPVEIRTYPTEIQGRKLVLGIARDITQRKNAESLILENQQKFAALFTRNPEPTVYTDSDFHVQDINPRFASLFGYSPDEIRDKSLNDVVVPSNMTEEAEELDKRAKEGYVYINTFRARKDGTLIPVSISAAPVLIQGHLSGYIGVYKDISEQVDAQKKLVAMNEKLRVVGGLTRHDVRNKLTAITGNAYLIKKETSGNDRVLDRLGEIEKAVQQSVKIFDFAKTYEMLGAEELAYVDVEKTVREAVSLFSDLKGVNVINDCHGFTVLADSLLQQLFYNLMDNSLKYGRKATRVRTHYQKSNAGELELVYEDDGVGISAAEKSKLFKEGYSTGGSTGYGLYLIKKMTEVYGWTIRETGEYGKGAKFVIRIPNRNSNGKENYQIA